MKGRQSAQIIDNNYKRSRGMKKGRKDFGKIISTIQSCIIELYLFAMFMIYPFYHGDGFRKMGVHKYEFFRWSAAAMLGGVLLPALFYSIVLLYKKQVKLQRDMWRKLSMLDCAVFAYALFAALSYVFSDFRAEAWEGANGWYMGMQAQLIFVLLYFVISRLWIRNRRVLWYLLLGSAGAFILAIMHRFMIDPLHMYVGLEDWQILQFLSTLGQATWYSSYVCTLYPIGIFLFWHCKEKKYRIPAAAYSVLAFATVVTQNSDSAYISLVLLLLLLFWFSFESNHAMKRFLEVLLLMLADFKLMGILQTVFADRAVQLDRLSVFMSQSIATWIALAIVAAVYVGLCEADKKGKVQITRLRFIRVAVLITFVAVILAAAAFIVINTRNINAGRTDGFISHNQYLYFNNAWGNGRGTTWMHTADMWRELPLSRKLIGVGPDAYSFYSYSVPEYAERLHTAWGNVTLTNAHNEWMNAFICYGILGAVSYIAIFITAVVRFTRARESRPLVFAVALCAVSYMGHNLFCYQQVLCTPFMFILFGIGEAVMRREKMIV